MFSLCGFMDGSLVLFALTCIGRGNPVNIPSSPPFPSPSLPSPPSLLHSCTSMQCFVYHMDHGLRSGGGIADVLEPATGDIVRLIFDITFFFVVIIILLAIIQGESLLTLQLWHD